LATTDDARVHYAVLKIRAVPGLHRQMAWGSVRLRSPAMQPFPQDPTACSARAAPGSGVPLPTSPRAHGRTSQPGPTARGRITSAPLTSCHPSLAAGMWPWTPPTIATAPVAP